MDTEMKPNIYPEIIGAFFQISSSVGSIHFRNNINMERSNEARNKRMSRTENGF